MTCSVWKDCDALSKPGSAIGMMIGGQRNTVSELTLRLPWTAFMVSCHSCLEGQCCKPSRAIFTAGALRGAGAAEAPRHASASRTAASRLVKPLHRRLALIRKLCHYLHSCSHLEQRCRLLHCPYFDGQRAAKKCAGCGLAEPRTCHEHSGEGKP